MKKGKVFIVALALLALVAGTAQAEMYVEGYIGANFAGSESAPLATALNAPAAVTASFPGAIDPAFQGGLKIGTWFVKEGFLGLNYPEWMKYLGFYLDFSYHRVDYAQRTVTANVVPFQINPFNINFQEKSEGGAATLAFMFAFRYGFLPDKEVPFGRLQPYVAVGPAIMWTWQQPTFTVGLPVFFPPIAVKPDSESVTTIALAAEAGVRWMCLKNVSLDVSFKYRYAHPVFDYEFPSVFFGPPVMDKAQYSAPYNFYSVQVGAAYHF
jgi:opacity protein-like surface antigen